MDDTDGDYLPDVYAAAPIPSGTPRSAFSYDLLGRQIQQSDFGGIASVAGASYSRTLSYNAKNQILVDDSTTLRLREGSTTLCDTWRTITRNDYDADGNLNTQSGGVGGSGYALGSIIWQHGQTYKNGSTDAIDDTMTRLDYVYWDNAVQSGIAYDKHYGWSNNNGPVFTLGNFHTDFSTSYTLNGFGQTTAAFVNDGVAKSVAYTLDAAGQIVRRDETRIGNTGQAAPHELLYRFAGKTMGMVGNNGTGDVGYDASITARSAASPAITSTTAGLFRNGTNYGSASYADFSQSLDPYNSGQQGSAGGGTYTVRSGDTLQAIAASLYGDGNLWYRIAEANGLSAGAALSEGQSLILPAGVTKSTHNAGTFQPYDASEAMGDTLPTTPKPPKSPKCGVFGKILATLVAVAATKLLGAIPGNLVSQAFNNIIGIQSGFSWKSLGLSVATAVVTAGVGSGLNALGNTALVANLGAQLGQAGQVLGDLARGAISSAASQGVAKLTGLQKSFSWTGVAAAGAGNALGSAASRGLANAGSFGNDVGSTMADTIAQAATRSAIQGNSFGDNLIASLPSALGNLAGRALAAGVGTAFDGKGGGDALAVVEAKGNAVADGLSYSERMGLRFRPETLDALPPLFDENGMYTSRDIMAENLGYERLQMMWEAEAKGEALQAEHRAAYKAEKVAAWRAGIEDERANGGIVVVGDKTRMKQLQANAQKAAYSAEGYGMPAYRYEIGAGHNDMFMDANGNAEFGSYMMATRGLSADNVDWWIKSTIGGASKFQLDVLVLPVLNKHVGYNPLIAKYRDGVQAHVDGINAKVDAQLLQDGKDLGKIYVISAAGLLATFAAPAAGSFVLSQGISGTTGAAAYYGTVATVGGGSSFVFERTKNWALGQKNTWGGDVSAVLGGSLGATGFKLLGSRASDAMNAVAWGGFSSGVSDFVGQRIEISAGRQTDFDFRKLFISTGIGASAASFTKLGWDIDGLNIGRNNSLGVYQGLQSRLANGSISQFQLRYALNGGLGQGAKGVWQSALGSSYGGLYQPVTQPSPNDVVRIK